MRIALSLLAAGLFAAAPAQAQAQHPTTLLAGPPRFESWTPAGPPGDRMSVSPTLSAAAGRPRVRNALIGGAIGTVAGLAFCTVVSNVMNDAATGVSTCTWKGYLLTGGIGFGLGFVVGLVA